MNLEQYAEHFYQHKENYKIIDNPNAAEPDLCAVFFSSVGLYSEKNFAARLDADYYEFHRNPVRRAGRNIYVRDVLLSFYLDGINARVNSADKLFALLKELTQGYRVITIGVSAGGYMAMLAGSVLGAEYAVSESGTVNLDFMKHHFAKFPWARKWLQAADRPYWQIVPYLQQKPVTVYEFEAYNNPCDRENAALLSAVPSVKFFNIACDSHGTVLDSPAIGAFINLLPRQIEELYHSCRGKVVSRAAFNFRVLSWGQLFKLYGKKFRKNLLKIKFSRKEKLLIIAGITIFNTTSNRLQH